MFIYESMRGKKTTLKSLSTLMGSISADHDKLTALGAITGQEASARVVPATSIHQADKLDTKISKDIGKLVEAVIAYIRDNPQKIRELFGPNLDPRVIRFECLKLLIAEAPNAEQLLKDVLKADNGVHFVNAASVEKMDTKFLEEFSKPPSKGGTDTGYDISVVFAIYEHLRVPDATISRFNDSLSQSGYLAQAVYDTMGQVRMDLERKVRTLQREETKPSFRDMKQQQDYVIKLEREVREQKSQLADFKPLADYAEAIIKLENALYAMKKNGHNPEQLRAASEALDVILKNIDYVNKMFETKFGKIVADSYSPPKFFPPLTKEQVMELKVLCCRAQGGLQLGAKEENTSQRRKKF